MGIFPSGRLLLHPSALSSVSGSVPGGARLSVGAVCAAALCECPTRHTGAFTPSSGAGRTPQLLLSNHPLLEPKPSSRWHQQDGKTGFKLLHNASKSPKCFTRHRQLDKKPRQRFVAEVKHPERPRVSFPGVGTAQGSRTRITHTHFQFTCTQASRGNCWEFPANWTLQAAEMLYWEDSSCCLSQQMHPS